MDEDHPFYVKGDSLKEVVNYNLSKDIDTNDLIPAKNPAQISPKENPIPGSRIDKTVLETNRVDYNGERI